MQARVQGQRQRVIQVPHVLRYEAPIGQGAGPPASCLLQLEPQPSYLSPLQFSSSCCSHWCWGVTIPLKVSTGVRDREAWPLPVAEQQ